MTRYLLPLGIGAAALLAAAIVAVTPAGADGLPSRNIPRSEPNVFADAPVAAERWTGFILSGYYGYGAVDGAINAGGFSFDGLSAAGQFGGVSAGYRVQLPQTFLVLGARGGYEWSNQELTVTGASIGIDKGWSADVLMGAAFGTAMPYIGIGRSVMQTTNSFGVSTPDLKGMRYIAGVEFRMPKLQGGWITPTLGLEVVYTDNDSIPLGGGANLDVTNLQAMGRLNFQLWK